MLAAIPETAKKLSEKVIHSNKPVIFRLKDVQPFGVTTRDFTTFRRSIVFASSKPIVPEMAGGRGRAMSYRSLTEEEFQEYKFNERNFSALLAKDIASICRRIKQADTEKKYSKRQTLQLLTICDAIIQWGGRNAYVEMSWKFIACSVLENEEKTRELVDFLVQVGILSQVENEIRYNEIFRDVATPDEDIANVPSIEEYKEEIDVRVRDFDDILRALDECRKIVVSRRSAFAEQKTPEGEYQKKIQQLEDKIKQEQMKNDSFTVALSSFGKMKEAYDELKTKNEELEGKIAEYRKSRKGLLARTKIVMDRFSQKMTDSTTQFRKDGKDSAFAARTNALIADTYKSIESTYKK